MADPRIENLDEFDEAEDLASTFCPRMTEEEYENQTSEATEQALDELCKFLESNPDAYYRIVRKRKQEEMENAGVFSFLKVKMMSFLHGERYPACLVSPQDLNKQLTQLENDMHKAYIYSEESKGRRYSRRLAARLTDGGEKENTPVIPSQNPLRRTRLEPSTTNEATPTTTGRAAARVLRSASRSSKKTSPLGFAKLAYLPVAAVQPSKSSSLTKAATSPVQTKPHSAALPPTPPVPPPPPPLPRNLSPQPSSLAPPPPPPPLLPEHRHRVRSPGTKSSSRTPKKGQQSRKRSFQEVSQNSDKSELSPSESVMRSGSGSAVRSGSGSAVRSTSGSAVQSTSGSAVQSTSGSAVQSASRSAVQSTSRSSVQSASGSNIVPGSNFLHEIQSRQAAMEARRLSENGRNKKLNDCGEKANVTPVASAPNSPSDSEFVTPESDIVPVFKKHKRTLSSVSTGSLFSLNSMHSELLSSNPLTRLRSTQIARSPGGTPLRDLAEQRMPQEPLHRALVTILREKFKNARTPSPQVTGSATGSVLSPYSNSRNASLNATFSP